MGCSVIIQILLSIINLILFGAVAGIGLRLYSFLNSLSIFQLEFFYSGNGINYIIGMICIAGTVISLIMFIVHLVACCCSSSGSGSGNISITQQSQTQQQVQVQTQQQMYQNQMQPQWNMNMGAMGYGYGTQFSGMNPNNQPFLGANNMVPPMNNTVPPTNNMVPPTNNTVPPTNNMTPPKNNITPPANNIAPPANIMAPPKNDIAPPASNTEPSVSITVPADNSMASLTNREDTSYTEYKNYTDFSSGLQKEFPASNNTSKNQYEYDL